MQNLDKFSLTLGITKVCALCMKSPSNKRNLLVERRIEKFFLILPSIFPLWYSICFIYLLQNLSWHLQKFYESVGLISYYFINMEKILLIDFKIYLYSALLEKNIFFLKFFRDYHLREIFKQIVFLLRYWFVLKWTFALNWERGYYLGGDLSAGELICPI